ncbi:autotransporter domain-containing protein [Thalassospira sp. HF15]|uniref:autotransporter family protein n=1 Tax=Thalassospira sp. HF15 TaxID=2722755 RepID=UPI00143079C8|nr:autotransporter outer membrane beta-barrel domain-containing protein [Thalassospira sp. HF15]NIY76075.1 autotransporter domain-containing protein [Thalassospira sp. HF15]
MSKGFRGLFRAGARRGGGVVVITLLCVAIFGIRVQAAEFTVSSGVTDTVAKTLTAGETGLVEQGGVLNVTAGNAITASGDAVQATNNGTISTEGGGASGMLGDAAATNARLVNNGTISTDGFTDRGIYGQGANSTLINRGAITTSGNGGVGILSTGSNPTLLNSGTITTSGTNATGLSNTGANATSINSGTITTSGSNAGGMVIAGINATLVNSGTITTSGSNARGMEAGGINATLVNSGTITTQDGHGVLVSGNGSTITVTKSGSITVSGSGTFGILSQGVNGTINVSGTVIATGAATQAISGTLNQTLNIKPGATIVGTIDLGAGTNAVNIDTSAGARSSTLTIANAGTVNTSAGGDGIALQSGSTVVIVDPTGIAANRAALGITTVGIHQAVSQQLARSNKPQPVVVAANDLEPGMLYAPQKPFVWGQVFGSYLSHGDDGANLGYRSRVGGAVGGYEKPIDDHSIGVFGGVSVGGMKTDEASLESDSSGFFVGGYGEYVVGDWAIDGTMVVGYQRHQDRRLVVDNLIGEETAQSDYNSVYVSPSLAVIRSIDIGGGIALRPSAQVNYTYGYYQGYDETGTTSSNLRVDAHAVDVINGRLQLVARQDLEDGVGEMELRGGMKYSYFGRDSVDVGLSNGPLVRYQGSGETSSHGGYVGGNLRYDLDRQMTFVADIELGFATSDERTASGFVGLEYRF